jgi:hypothetical protein
LAGSALTWSLIGWKHWLNLPLIFWKHWLEALSYLCSYDWKD